MERRGMFSSGRDRLTDLARRQRRRNNSFLLVFAVGLLVFCAAAGALFYALRPAVLKVAVGPAGSSDHKVIEAMADAFASEGRTIRLSPVVTDGTVEALALLGRGQADLAVGRGDLDMPADAQIVATIRKNYVVLWAPSGLMKRAKTKVAPKIKEIADLAGHRVGIIGKTGANAALLRLILVGSGVDASKVSVKHFGTDKLDDLAQDSALDAFMTVGPLDSKITADAIAATARTRGSPKFLAIETSEAIALKHPSYDSEEIPPSVFSADPAWPDDKVETVSVSHLILARKSLSETTVAAFFRQLFAVRQIIAKQVPGAALIAKPDTEKDYQLSIHRGAAAVIDGTERTFLDRYGDYFWFGLLLLSGIGSAAAWLRRYINRDEREENTSHRKRLLDMVSDARTAESAQDLLALQQEADSIIRETLECYDSGAIEEEELAAFGLVIELLNLAIMERRTVLRGPLEQVRGIAIGQGSGPRG
jgi:TRAP transporter TAXI family solute receptor